jgi:hypothetical protein
LIHKIATTFNVPGQELKQSMFEELHQEKEQEIEQSAPGFNQRSYAWEMIPTDFAKMANNLARAFNLKREDVIDVFSESVKKENFKKLVTQSVQNLPKLGEKLFTPDYAKKKSRSKSMSKTLRSAGLSTVPMSEEMDI